MKINQRQESTKAGSENCFEGSMIWDIKDPIVAKCLRDYLAACFKDASFSSASSPLPPMPGHPGPPLGEISCNKAFFLVTDSFDTYQMYKESVIFGIFLRQPKTLIPKGIDLGKDFSLMDMPIRCAEVARALQRNLREYKTFLMVSEERFKIGSYYFIPQERCLSHGNHSEKIILTEKETALLEILCAREGSLITKKEILKKVWSYDESVSTRTIESHIYALRKKIKKCSDETHLLTEKGGYRLKEAMTKGG